MEDKDLVYVDYDVWILPGEEDGEEMIFDTTDRITAEKEEIFDENEKYGPKPVILGNGEIIEGFEKALMDAEVEKKGSVEVPPEEGFGNRDPRKIELFSRRELDRKGVDIVEGGRVQMDNRIGTIIQATAGRVRVDFNNPLAGKTVRYDFTITEKAETPEEIVKAILLKDYDDVDFEVEIGEDTIDVILPDVCKYDQAWFVAKYRVVGDVRNLLDTETLRFIEPYATNESEEEAAIEEGADVEEAEQSQEEVEEEGSGQPQENSEEEGSEQPQEEVEEE